MSPRTSAFLNPKPGLLSPLPFCLVVSVWFSPPGQGIAFMSAKTTQAFYYLLSAPPSVLGRSLAWDAWWLDPIWNEPVSSNWITTKTFQKGQVTRARGTRLSSVLNSWRQEFLQPRKAKSSLKMLSCGENGSIANEDTMTEPGEGLRRPLLSVKGYQKIVIAQRSVEYSWLTWRPVPEGPTI